MSKSGWRRSRRGFLNPVTSRDVHDGRRDIFIIWNLNRIVIDNSGCQQDNSCIYFLETA